MSARVLLIEPDRVLGKTYQAALEAADFIVARVINASAALLALDKDKPDIIILEPQLVSHGGFEFLYELRSYSDWQSIPVIIQSMIPAETLRHMQPALKQLGISKHLYKPQTSLKQLIDTSWEVLPVTTI